ncbi:hybrid sensor histidine kinase/response regulator [Pseudanabaena sp. UWO310]|uniref:hybrid sensor histidine kinase/response regulator n=1 Tax=Pseudanabaena sp. UWO310 TaxID=2480795 RepID=UPI001157C690|nr:hybrid sensor histidine kinase/response regulator [Pseudanabaena sp. UWO310]TYQ31223.1 hybrid sensor histidine kinase/response regulator [Pseudanabaena sp. UWO310]
MSIPVIIVEDERLVAQDIAQILRDEGYTICAIAVDAQTAIQKILEYSPKLVLLDIRIKGDIDGIKLAQFIQSFCDIPVVYLTAFSDAETLKRAQSTNPMGYVVKPFRQEQLLSTLAIALTTHRAQNDEQKETTLKEKLLSVVSHELRTPLNAILGFSDCLKEEVFGSINPKQLEAIQVINSSGDHLLNLVNNMIDLSMLEAGEFKLTIEPMSLAALCQTCLGCVAKIAVPKRIKVESKIQEGIPSMILDERRIFQALMHLLNNAVKFTPENGHIILELTCENQPDYQRESNFTTPVRISVTDSGIGIATEDLHRIFQPFKQVDTGYSRKYDGMGLGLTFVKKIIELHGGSVEATSELGVGSRFTISLPCNDLSSSQTSELSFTAH